MSQGTLQFQAVHKDAAAAKGRGRCALKTVASSAHCGFFRVRDLHSVELLPH